MKNFAKELKKFFRLFFAAHGAFTSDKVDSKTYRKSGLLQLISIVPASIVLIFILRSYGLEAALVGFLVIALLTVLADLWSRRP